MSDSNHEPDANAEKALFVFQPEFSAKACLFCFVIALVGGIFVTNDHNMVLAALVTAPMLAAPVFALWGCAVGLLRWRKLTPDSKRWTLILIVLTVVLMAFLLPVL